MRYKLKERFEADTIWELRFAITDTAGESGVLAQAFAGGEEVLTLSRDTTLRVVIRTHEGDTERQFLLTSRARCGAVRLVWQVFSVRLYVDGRLEDEEWPLGTPAGGVWEMETGGTASFLGSRILETEADCEEEPETVFTGPFQNFVVPGHNTGVGDCMPFARDGRYCLYYLFDRRSHKSKCGLGAHQWAQVSSGDLKTWTIHPMAVRITHQWEGSICTGSLIQKDGRTYAFYAVRMADRSPARLTRAVSDDGVHFEKTENYFALTAPYEPVSARDPMVFWGADGQYHMLVTTSLPEKGRYGGCLAHLTSGDLEEWTQREPFLVPGYADQPECSDYFEWNGWYYLIFSNFGIARYRMSRDPFGPWIRPENDLLDSLEIKVPKTAAFGDRRLCTGFLARRPRKYAGSAVTHELFQRSDGTLGIRQPEEILPAVKKRIQPADLFLDAGQNRAEAPLAAMEGDFRLKAVLQCGRGRENVLAGMLLTMGTGEGAPRSYRIEMEPASNTAVIIRPGEDYDLGSGRDLLKDVKLSGPVQVDLLVQDDILDLMLSDGRGMTLRMDDSVRNAGQKGSSVSFYVMGGTLAVEQIELDCL